MLEAEAVWGGHMIDPLTALAFSVQTQPGVYAALLGSGVSRSAQIPTGWGIVGQLIRRLAATRGEEVSGDPVDWYRGVFNEPVGFSALIHALAPARTERQALLRQFIEPDPARPDQRRPTAAHAALARLARSGHTRVFLTTNFDRLLEQALEAEGISPLVVANAAAAAGAAPFQHENVVVFKLHGDYLDPDSMLVTEDELAAYAPAVQARLDRTLDDYGLIVCGWSSEWDPALRESIVASTARRYPLYLTGLTDSPPRPTQELLNARHGTFVAIADADTFLTALDSRIAAIEALNEPHPLDKAALVAAVKHALPRPERRIELDDLVVGAAERVAADISDAVQFPQNRRCANDLEWTKEYLDQVFGIAAVTRPAAEVLAACAAWGEDQHAALIARAMTHLAHGFDPSSGTFQEALVGLRKLPALLCLYAGGAVAVSRGNYRLLKALAVDPVVTLRNDMGRLPLITQLHIQAVFTNQALAEAVARRWVDPDGFDDERLKAIVAGGGGPTYYAPGSEVLSRWVSDVTARYLPAAEQASTFQRLEVLLDLLAIHEDSETDLYTHGPSFGAYANRTHGAAPELQLKSELETQGDLWPPVAQGLFGGSLSLAGQAFDALEVDVAMVRQRRF